MILNIDLPNELN